MGDTAMRFPDRFLWGTATSAYQVEGGNSNTNWSLWEREPGRVLLGQRAGLACDWWGGRWREDLDRAAAAGQNAHRTSVEWSRVQPSPDRWDDAALDYYVTLVRGIRERGMVPFITLHHFAEPLWITERGGWENEATAGLFAAYVRRVVAALKDEVSLWATINEPNVLAYSGYVSGENPPGKHDLNLGFRVMASLVRGHAAAYAAIHELQPAARVGITLYYRGFVPARRWFPLDRLAASLQHRLFDDIFPRALTDGTVDYLRSKTRIPQAARTQDFLAIDYYTTDHVAFSPSSAGSAFGRNFYPTGSDLSDTGYIASVPEGLYNLVRWAKRFGLPLIVSENGVEDADDHLRPRFLAAHLHQLWRARSLGVPIQGYFHWTLVDNFEWERGWTQRFGLWELDIETQERRKRPSADLYAEVCRANALTRESVERHAPEALERIFGRNRLSVPRSRADRAR